MNNSVTTPDISAATLAVTNLSGALHGLHTYLGQGAAQRLAQNAKRLRPYKKAPFTARSHVNYWRQRFAVTNACGIANFINRAAQHLVLKSTL